MRTHLNGLLIVAILAISTAPLYAQRQQQNVAKLKADARNLVGIIGSDKTKTQTYCQIDDLSEQLLQAVQEKDRKKANALAEKIAELNKKMGPEFAALIDIEKHVDLNSRDGQEIASIVVSLGESCGEKWGATRRSGTDEAPQRLTFSIGALPAARSIGPSMMFETRRSQVQILMGHET